MRLGRLAGDSGLMGLGLAGTGAALICVAIAPRMALAGWLAAVVFVQSVAMGSLVLLALMRLVGGAWEEDLRSTCEAASGLWSLVVLAFLPVLLGIGALQEWPHESAENAFQRAWLGPLPFALRTLLWFVGLAAIARALVGGRSSEATAAAALIAMTLGASLLAVDWLVLLDSGFHPAGSGLQVFALEMCAACLVLVLLRLTRRPEPQHPGLLGWLMVAFLLLWLYFRFMPYLVVWADNLSDEAQLPADRSPGPWMPVFAAIGLSGIAPLLALLLPQVRRSPRALVFAAAFALPGICLEFASLAIPGRGPIAALAFLFALAGLGSLSATFLAPGESWRFPPGKRAT